MDPEAEPPYSKWLEPITKGILTTKIVLLYADAANFISIHQYWQFGNSSLSINPAPHQKRNIQMFEYVYAYIHVNIHANVHTHYIHTYTHINVTIIIKLSPLPATNRIFYGNLCISETRCVSMESFLVIHLTLTRENYNISKGSYLNFFEHLLSDCFRWLVLVKKISWQFCSLFSVI